MPPEVIRRIPKMQERARTLRAAGKTLGFVPTMGALHEGHLSLMRRCRAENDISVTSIFVNPTQFAPDEDFERYPRPFDEDLRKAEKVGVDIVFTTAMDEMYPAGFSTYVVEKKVTARLCGRSRPAFFRGVLTVVLKLFQVVQPHRAYFGEKDYQQCVAVRKMVRDFHLDLEVVPCPTVREEDGLAASSRNAYLTPSERSQALVIPGSLDLAESLVSGGLRRASELTERVREAIRKAPSARIDYVEALGAEDLSPLEPLEGKVVVAVAVWLGDTRLIDNRILTIDP